MLVQASSHLPNFLFRTRSLGPSGIPKSVPSCPYIARGLKETYLKYHTNGSITLNASKQDTVA